MFLAVFMVYGIREENLVVAADHFYEQQERSTRDTKTMNDVVLL